MAARNGTALIIALLVLFLGVRPIAKGLMKKRDEATARPALAIGGAGGMLPGSAPLPAEMMDKSLGYEDRVGLVRGFTRENPARAALAVRDMIQADGQ